MNEQLPDELISAYLDGELTSEEQTQVEQLLVDSAEHRQTFEELRALRNSLQSLPSFGLGDDFADRVVQRAKQAAASAESGDAASGDAGTDETSDDQEPDHVELSQPNPGNPRVALGAIATVAATLIIAAFIASHKVEPEHDGLAIHVEQGKAAPAQSNSATLSDHQGEEMRELPVNGLVTELEGLEPKDDSRGEVLKKLNRNPNVLGRKYKAEGKPQQGLGTKKPVSSTPSEFKREDAPHLQPFDAPSKKARDSGSSMKRKALPGRGGSGGVDSVKETRGKNSPAPTAGAFGDPLAAGTAFARSQAEEAHVDFYILVVDFIPTAIAAGNLDRSLRRNGILLGAANETLARDEVAGGQLAEVADEAYFRSAQDLVSRELSRADMAKQVEALDALVVEASPHQIEAVFEELHQTGDLVALNIVQEPNAARTATRGRELQLGAFNKEVTNGAVRPLRELFAWRRRTRAAGQPLADSEPSGNESRPTDAQSQDPKPVETAAGSRAKVASRLGAAPKDAPAPEKPGSAPAAEERLGGGIKQDSQKKAGARRQFEGVASRVPLNQRATLELLAKNGGQLPFNRANREARNEVEKIADKESKADENKGAALSSRFALEKAVERQAGKLLESQIAPLQEQAEADTDALRSSAPPQDRVRVLVFLRASPSPPAPSASPAAESAPK